MTTTDRPARTPGTFSRWMQHRANARAARRIRKGKGSMMGMDMLILHTVGRRSGLDRETPLMWLPCEGESLLVVASGGGDLNPDWHANLAAHPDRVAVELPGRDPVRVTPHELTGPARDEAWQRVATTQPRIAKYQRKSTRVYPLVKLDPR